MLFLLHSIQTVLPLWIITIGAVVLLVAVFIITGIVVFCCWCRGKLPPHHYIILLDSQFIVITGLQVRVIRPEDTPIESDNYHSSKDTKRNPLLAAVGQTWLLYEGN